MVRVPPPRAVSLSTVSVPAFTVTPPANELLPFSASVTPGTFRLRPPVPEMVPEKERVPVSVPPTLTTAATSMGPPMTAPPKPVRLKLMKGIGPPLETKPRLLPGGARDCERSVGIQAVERQAAEQERVAQVVDVGRPDPAERREHQLGRGHRRPEAVRPASCPASSSCRQWRCRCTFARPPEPPPDTTIQRPRRAAPRRTDQ